MNINIIIDFVQISYIFISELFLYLLYRDVHHTFERICEKLVKINILFVKFFQAFALNNNFIDTNINEKLLKYMDNAPYEDSDIDYETLEKISRENKWNIHYKPINSGMISLVFKAENICNLNSYENQYYIIKMKRKNIQKKLDEAINFFLYFVYLCSFIPIINHYKIKELIETNIEIIKHQTNFAEEINNMELMRENCKNLKYIKIPKNYSKMNSQYDDVIIMEYLDGITINELSKEYYNDYAKLVIKFGIVTTIIHGVAHGDLHGGNILFMKNGNNKYLGIIDFGIIYKVGEKYRELLFELVTGLFVLNPRELAIKALTSDALEPIGVFNTLPEKISEKILDNIEEIIGDVIHKKNANQSQIYKALLCLNEIIQSEELTQIGIKPCDDFVKSQLVLAMAHGVTLTLCKENYVLFMEQILNELFHIDLLTS